MYISHECSIYTYLTIGSSLVSSFTHTSPIGLVFIGPLHRSFPLVTPTHWKLILIIQDHSKWDSSFLSSLPAFLMQVEGPLPLFIIVNIIIVQWISLQTVNVLVVTKIKTARSLESFAFLALGIFGLSSQPAANVARDWEGCVLYCIFSTYLWWRNKKIELILCN